MKVTRTLTPCNTILFWFRNYSDSIAKYKKFFKNVIPKYDLYYDLLGCVKVGKILSFAELSYA